MTTGGPGPGPLRSSSSDHDTGDGWSHYVTMASQVLGNPELARERLGGVVHVVSSCSVAKHCQTHFDEVGKVQ